MANRRETEQQLDRLKSMREYLIRQAVEWYCEASARNEYSGASSDGSDYRSKVAIYFDRERKQPVAKVMLYPKGSEGNFCIILDANGEQIDWTFTQETWLQNF